MIALIGIPVGIATALVPGAGTLQAALVCLSLGLTPEAAIMAYVSAMTTNTLKEARLPAWSAEIHQLGALYGPNNEYLGLNSINPDLVIPQLANCKLLGWLAGLFIGALLVHLGIFSLAGFSWLLVPLCWLRYGLPGLGFLVFTNVLLSLSDWYLAPQPIFAMSAGLFLFPSALRPIGRPKGTLIELVPEVNLPLACLGGLAGSLIPGLNSSVYTHTLGKGDQSRLVTSALASSMQEAIGLTLLVGGKVSGKSAIALLAGSQMHQVSPWLLVGCTLIVALLPLCFNSLDIVILPVSQLLAITLAVGTALIAGGVSYGLVCLVSGLILDQVLSQTQTDPSLKSWTFIGGLLV